MLTANEQHLDTNVDLHHVVRKALNTLVRLLGLLGFEVALEDLDCFLHATQGGNADIFSISRRLTTSQLRVPRSSDTSIK